MPTERTCPFAPGRLFPSEDFGNGWLMSAQADVGYQCEPRICLPYLEEYESVEVKIDGPGGMLVDPSALGLPAAIAAKFTPLDSSHCPSLGCQITQSDLVVLREVLRHAHLNPAAGIPSGRIGWANQTIWLVANEEQAEAVRAGGLEAVEMPQGALGLGVQFTVDEREVAELPVALAYQIEDGANILDLRNTGDRQQWQDGGREGVDGLYDPGLGLVLFNHGCVYRDEFDSGYRR